MKVNHPIVSRIEAKSSGCLHGIFLFETSSTNDQLKDLAKAGKLSKPTVLITDNQTSGRGTRQRKWFQTIGKDISFSLAIPFEGNDLHDSRISLVIGAMLVQALNAGPLANSPGLLIANKWPNDILLGRKQKKCGGILIETTAGWMVIGIGVNLNSLPGDYPDNISATTTTIHEQLGKQLNRNEACSGLILSIARNIGVMGSPHRVNIDIEKWLEKWSTQDATVGKQYLLERDEDRFAVVAEGVDLQSGGLICSDADGCKFTVTNYTELEEIK